jgi:phosphoserine phosphatase
VSCVRYPVVVFDLDGTLLRGTTVSLRLAEWMGRGEIVDQLERRFHAGEITNREVADVSASWFTGLAVDEIWAELAAGPWIEGIEDTVAALIAAGCEVLLGTVTWRFAAEMLQRRYGFHAVSGTEMQLQDGVLSGKVSRYFDEFDKLRFVEGWCAMRGHPLAGVAAIGDSRSDIPLFSQAGCAIALNATADARSAADVAVDTDRLTDLLDLLLEGDARPPDAGARVGGGVEREAKFVVGAGLRFPSLEVPGALVTAPRREQLQTTYWDTPDGLLAATKRSLRYRHGEGWTGKRELSSHTVVLARSEEHFPGDGAEPPARALAFLEVGDRRGDFARAVQLRVRRERCEIRSSQADTLLIDAIDDDVTVLDQSGRPTTRFREVELELMHPDGESTLQTLVARVIAAGVVSDAPMSKYERALSIVGAGDGD